MSRKKGSKKRIAVLGASALCALALVIYFWEKPVPHRDIVDAMRPLNSERKITQSIAETNPKFRHIAFAEAPEEISPVFGSQIASVLTAIKSLFHTPPPAAKKEYGTWIWTPILAMSPDYMRSITSGAKANGINSIYVSIDSYLDIYVMEDALEKARMERLFTQNLEEFIELAGENGIEVDAEAGWQNWGEEGNSYKPLAILEYVINYNRTHEKKFRGFQYDVEPYLLDAYKEDKAKVLKNFVALVDNTRYFLGGEDLNFSVVIPDFYDRRDGATPKFSYGGKTDYAFGHLLRVLDKRPGSSIIVMSYRNFAEGENGSIEITYNEMRTARKATQTKVIVAQETGDVPPPYITFFNTSRSELMKQIGLINQKFQNRPTFGGIAIHYVNSFLEMK